MKKKLKKTVRIMGGVVLAFVLTIVALIVLWPKPPKPPEHITSVAELETYLNQLTEFGAPPGLSLVVVKDGKIVYSKGFGLADGPNKIVASPDTVYHWWSMTKIPTAIAILQLQEQGLLQLDDPVVNYLPFFSVQYPSANSQVVTIRHLLNHSSGLPDPMPAMLGMVHHADEPPVNRTALVETLLPDYAKLTFEPGTQAVYTNLGYMVLGAVIEKVSGQTYEDYVREHILQPLSMEHTDFVYTEAMRPYEAVGSHPVIRIHATGGSPAEPIFWLEGGPGVSNMGFKPPPELLANHDFVMVGYRGVDGSSVLNCPESVRALRISNPLSDESLAKLSEALGQCAARLQAEGVDLDGYTSSCRETLILFTLTQFSFGGIGVSKPSR